ncbi:hypothetical protein NKJ40_09140 [Mesorhizobium sp. M0119]|uniref:hypothetical protein n=1 Tax=unclassified Mesorhizobium TaxID=325217 RepID=UPI00333C32AB
MAVFEKELIELEIAERVLARLSGAERVEARPANQPTAAPFKGILAKKLTLPEMIEAVVREKQETSSHFDGWEPKEIGKQIERKYSVDPGGAAVSSITWRMWKRGQLEKVEGTSAYRLPDKQKPADLLSPTGEQPAGLSDQPARDGEPVQEVAHDNINS